MFARVDVFDHVVVVVVAIVVVLMLLLLLVFYGGAFIDRGFPSKAHNLSNSRGSGFFSLLPRS